MSLSRCSSSRTLAVIGDLGMLSSKSLIDRPSERNCSNSRAFHWKVSLLHGEKHMIDIQVFHSLRPTVRCLGPETLILPGDAWKTPNPFKSWTFWMVQNARYCCFRTYLFSWICNDFVYQNPVGILSILYRYLLDSYLLTREFGFGEDPNCGVRQIVEFSDRFHELKSKICSERPDRVQDLSTFVRNWIQSNCWTLHMIWRLTFRRIPFNGLSRTFHHNWQFRNFLWLHLTVNHLKKFEFSEDFEPWGCLSRDQVQQRGRVDSEWAITQFSPLLSRLRAITSVLKRRNRTFETVGGSEVTMTVDQFNSHLKAMSSHDRFRNN
jgi:hypothetical protein